MDRIEHSACAMVATRVSVVGWRVQIPERRRRERMEARRQRGGRWEEEGEEVGSGLNGVRWE